PSPRARRRRASRHRRALPVRQDHPEAVSRRRPGRARGPARPRRRGPGPARRRRVASPPGFRSIRLETTAGIAVLTLSRPGARNAINLEVVQEIRAALGRLARDGGARVLILTGAGRTAF